MYMFIISISLYIAFKYLNERSLNMSLDHQADLVIKFVPVGYICRSKQL